jgi:hypothetical protein
MATNALQITSILVNPTNYLGEAGLTRCGSFHPDFTLFWRDADARQYIAMICFSCAEVRLMGRQKDYRYTITSAAKDQLLAHLSPYDEKRPEWSIARIVIESHGSGQRAQHVGQSAQLFSRRTGKNVQARGGDSIDIHGHIYIITSISETNVAAVCRDKGVTNMIPVDKSMTAVEVINGKSAPTQHEHR